MKVNAERTVLYATSVVSVLALIFSINAQKRLVYVEYDVVDKHETTMNLIGQNSQRINALENPGFTPTFEGERGNFE